MKKKTKIDPNRKLKIIDFIASYSEKYGKAPTMEEIRKAVKLKALSGVWQHLNELGFTLGDRNWWKKNKKELADKLACPTCKRSFVNKL